MEVATILAGDFERIKVVIDQGSGQTIHDVERVFESTGWRHAGYDTSSDFISIPTPVFVRQKLTPPFFGARHE